ncbi:hypothetical protein L6452_30322 [Arctium lappa]|uniref:Uncharacterized protein n=1 Tax=Arctium lappa TaxID=4217 RepID=A0ACB8ZJ72_ARCLA|nr:hypothetical protein L6452_30322 [Arctium lappa]
MGDDNNMVIALDLNQEPYVDSSPPSPPTPPSSDELETSQVGIVDRIRQLQAVTARANQRQRWRQSKNNPELTYYMPVVIKPTVDKKNKNQGDNSGSSSGEERVRNCKRDISHLAKALEMDLDANKPDNGNFFNCNICLVMAKNPILTCCGHLFCSSCFDQVPYVDSISKECPTCEGEVTNSNIIPVYGNGKNSRTFWTVWTRQSTHLVDFDGRDFHRCRPSFAAKSIYWKFLSRIVLGNNMTYGVFGE